MGVAVDNISMLSIGGLSVISLSCLSNLELSVSGLSNTILVPAGGT